MTGGPIPDLVALVPMRHHSERVPGKNYRKLAGRPLYAHILEALLQVSVIDQIVVDTDSPLIKEGIARDFAGIMVLDRPDHLAADDLSMNKVLLHDVEQIEASFYLQTHSTNPLLQPDTISGAIRAFFDAYPDRDSLFSVTALHTRLWSAEGQPMNHDPSELLRTQDLQAVYEENSCLYIFERESFLRMRTRIGDRPLLYETRKAESLDIDDEFAFKLADILLKFGNGPH